MQGNPSWDLFIALFLIIGVSYGFMLQREKVVITLVSIYAGIVVSQILTPLVQQFFVGDTTLFNSLFIKANASAFSIRSIIFGAIIILLTVKSGIAGVRVRGLMSPIEAGLYSILSSILILTTLISFMGDEERIRLLGASRIANLIYTYHIWWAVLPIVVLVIFGKQHTIRDTE